MKYALIAGVGLACFTGYQAFAQYSPTHIFGIGAKSCAYWQSTPATVSEGHAWIYGYWSGLNTHSNKSRTVGSRTDGVGVVAEVKKICDARPSMTLTDATLSAYTEMAEGK
jgi:hypothetical protein